VIKNN